MSENIGVRVRRIISANLNSLVDAMEQSNADGIMREAIREVERALDDVKSELGKTMAAKAQCQRAITRTREKISEHGDKAAFAIEQGREDLAAAAIARQIDLERHIPVFEATLATHNEKEAELNSYAGALSARMAEMECDLAAFSQAGMMNAPDDHMNTANSTVQSAERRAENAGRTFDRVLGGTMGAGTPQSKALRETAAQLHELDKLQRDDDIGQRLAALKASRAG